jgi:hypothetical protein
MLTDNVFDIFERNDAANLFSAVGPCQFRTWIDQNALISVFDQIDMALKGVVFKMMADPPDSWCDFDRFGEISLIVEWRNGR